MGKKAGFNLGKKPVQHREQRKERIEIDPEFQGLIPPLRPDELAELRASIETEGCRDALVVWDAPDGRVILIDGHNRFSICRELGLRFDMREMRFESRGDVIEWMLRNQLGRRNLTDEQRAYLRGKQYQIQKQRHGGKREASGKNSHLKTSEMVAAEHSVSEATIRKDATFAQGLDRIGAANPELKQQVLSGQAKVRKKDVQQLAALPEIPAFESADEITQFVQQQTEPTDRPDPPDGFRYLARDVAARAERLLKAKTRSVRLARLAELRAALDELGQHLEG